MVFGLLSAVAAVPAIVGTTEAIKQGQQANAREQHRGRKSNMIITLPSRNRYSQKFDNALIVLKDGKVCGIPKIRDVMMRPDEALTE